VISAADVAAAAERIRPYVVRTPLERSAHLSAYCGVDVWLKLECFQTTGSFKLRGALNALLGLSREQRERGVLTVSAGNHGLGVARAARLLGIRASVVVPKTASPAKIEALLHAGCTLVQYGASYDEAEHYGHQRAERDEHVFVSAYNDPAVIAGGGTIALDVLEELPETQSYVVPAGGGGLIGGIGIVARAHGRSVYGVQAAASPALHAALEAGARVEVEVRPTLADGLAGNVEPGSITLDLLRQHVQAIALVEEREIAEAMRFLLFEEHVLAEGSAAVGVAALLHQRLRLTGPTVVVLTGRNVAAAVLQQYVLARD